MVEAGVIPFGGCIEDLTAMQESVLMVMFLSEKTRNYPLAEDTPLTVSGGYFLCMLGMVFETYHRNKMKDLASLGWLTIRRRSGVLYYTLTDSAQVTLADHCLQAGDFALHN